MPEETTAAEATPEAVETPTEETPLETTTTPAATPTVDATGQNSGDAPDDRKFTQADMEKAIKERLDRAKESHKKANADALAAKDAEHQEALSKANTERDEANAKARKSEIALWQYQAATKVGLPIALAERLQGDTLKDLEADAKTMLDAMPKPPAPNINANNAAGGAPAAGQMSEAEKKELAARLGVNPKYM